MNKDGLEKINQIDQELKKIDRFLEYYDMKPRASLLALFKQKFLFSIKLKPYGGLPKTEYEISQDLTSEIVKVIRENRAKLVVEQEELWGKE